ncbi:MAG: hypothetical protein CVV44_22395 [Spirochaetae bacterium HGW-Spirochaetae-1]|jgi:hypothetical protein|nr:MAG: hypothetical protein CVV44_22395 [Spirochaetae bacterium HGW-Spirochaetae-1]
MELLLKRLLKTAIFIITFYVSARLFLGLLKRRNSEVKLFDPEVVFLAGISAALVTMFFSKVLLPLF